MGRCPPRVQCRGVIPPLSHIMLHSDTLANEFNEILNGVEIFAPFQPLDPAVTFYAPLRNTVRDLRLSQDDFSRASDAWYRDGSGIYRNAGINRARFEEGRLLMEPASTNKCESYNRATSLDGWFPAGDPAAVFQIVSDPGLAALSDILPPGPVCFELDNSAGAGNHNRFSAGAPGNTEIHTLSAWIKVLSGTGYLQTTGASPSIQLNTLEHGEWSRVTVTGQVLAINHYLQVRADAGSIIRFVLNQYEQSSVVTSPIITEGTAGQRAADVLTWENVQSIINNAEGTIVVEHQPGFIYEEVSTNTRYDLVGVPNRILYYERSSSDISYYRSQDLTPDYPNVVLQGGVGPIVRNDVFLVAVRWSQGIPDFQVGYRDPSGWTWGTPRAFLAYDPEDVLALHPFPQNPSRFADLTVYDVDLGVSGIEERYP